MKYCIPFLAFLIIHFGTYAFSRPDENGFGYTPGADSLPTVLTKNRADIVGSKLRNEAFLELAEHQLPGTKQEWDKYRTNLNNQIIKKAGIYSNESKFHPGATKTTTGKSHLRTEQFDFEVFINGDIQDLNDIKSVTYNFNSETLKQQIVTSTDPSSKFKVGYLGWGCLSLINITINLKNGE